MALGLEQVFLDDVQVENPLQAEEEDLLCLALVVGVAIPRKALLQYKKRVMFFDNTHPRNKAYTSFWQVHERQNHPSLDASSRRLGNTSSPSSKRLQEIPDRSVGEDC